MFSHAFNFVFAAVFMFTIVQKSTCLECFTCSSPFGGYCDKVPNTNLSVEDCPNQLCYQLVHNVYAMKGYSSFIQRGCTADEECKSVAVPSHEPVHRSCIACTFNLCNNAWLYHRDVEEGKSSTNLMPFQTLISTILLGLVIK